MRLRSALAAAALGAAIAAGPALAQDSAMPDTGAVQQLLDERRLIAITDAIDSAVDNKDWTATRAYFADDLRVSLPGGAADQPMRADELVGGWEANLYPEKTSFHLRGNHAVEIQGDTALVRSAGYAWNKLDGFEGGDLWEVWGHYEHRFERRGGDWKVTGFGFRPVHQRGNAAIPGYRPGG